MSALSFVSESLEESQRLGECLAAALTAGAADGGCGGLTIALDGELGAGKTALVRSVCGALGADPDTVNSPTFVLMQLYHGGELPVAHFDTYRLGDVDEFLAIGGEDHLLDDQTVCFVEWAERIADVIPTDHLAIRIHHRGETSRACELSAGGPRSEFVLAKLGRLLSQEAGS